MFSAVPGFCYVSNLLTFIINKKSKTYFELDSTLTKLGPSFLKLQLANNKANRNENITKIKLLQV